MCNGLLCRVIFFESALINMFSFQQYNGPLAVGCLGDKQTVWLDMLFRWLLVLFIPLSASLASLLSIAVGFILTKGTSTRIKQLGKLFAFGVMGILKTSYIVTTFFFRGAYAKWFFVDDVPE